MTSHKPNADGSVTDDIVASRLANDVSLAAIEAVYGDDAYGVDDEWADEVPDIGEDC